jgi:G3E family GTPase
MPEARYVMIGGFLGAGKTTAVLRIAEQLTREGLRVGLITNDQSFGLVDTTMLSAHGFPVEEITGGCFCCRFNSLVAAADKLSADSTPDVFIAEPVGSCTDLKATVDYPLRRMYGDSYSIAPLSVLVDPIRALRILGLEAGKQFSPKVNYIYRKQLEEADLILINKIDLVTPERLETLRLALETEFPKATVMPISAREGTGVPGWIERLSTDEARTADAMEVDYDTYAEGEALLGWLNCTLRLSVDEPLDGNALLLELAGDVRRRLHERDAEIAHLKLTLTPDEGNDLCVVNTVRSDRDPEASHTLDDEVDAGELILNLRAEADPEALTEIVTAALETLRGTGVTVEVEHLERFRPGRPVPTHRLLAA